MDSLSSADLEQWSDFMNYDIHFSVALIVESSTYGAYLIIFCIALYTLLRGGNRSAATILQLMAFCSTFALSTSLWACDIAMHVLSLQVDRLSVLVSSPIAQAQSVRYTASVNILIFTSDRLFELNFLVGDALLAWRVYVVYKSQSISWVGGGFMILWLGMFGTRATTHDLELSEGLFHISGLIVRETVCWAPTIQSEDSPLCAVLRETVWAMSITLNIFASLLIWRIIRQRKAALQRDGLSRSQVDRALYILLVFGVVYTVLGLTSFIVPPNYGAVGSTISAFGAVISSAGDQIVGIYPTIVTVFVLNQEMIFGTQTVSPSLEANGTTASIRFNGNVASYNSRDQRTTALSLAEVTRTGDNSSVSRTVTLDAQAAPSSTMGTRETAHPGSVKDPYEATPELIARVFDLARNGDTEQLEARLEAGLYVNLANHTGATLLMLAAYYGHAPTVSALIKRGADVNALNDEGQSPLAGAVFKGEDEVVKLLVQEGADPHAGQPSAVQAATMFNRTQYLELFSQRGGIQAQAAGAQETAETQQPSISEA